MTSELAQSAGLPHRQVELYALLTRQARLYTMGDSGSLPAETAQELLHSIRFTIQTHLDTGGAQAGAPLEALFVGGGREIWRRTEEAKKLYAVARQTDPEYGSIAYRDTLDALGCFFRLYDLRFFAHQIPCMIDYPLCLPVSESLEGVLFIGEYLRRLILENRLCRCFGRQDAMEVLSRFRAGYRELVVNLFQPLLFCALGLALLERDATALHMSPGDCQSLYERFHPWEEAGACAQVRAAANRLCVCFKLWASDMRAYVAQAADGLLPLLRVSSREGYRNLFCALQIEKSNCQ